MSSTKRGNDGAIPCRRCATLCRQSNIRETSCGTSITPALEEAYLLFSNCHWIPLNRQVGISWLSKSRSRGNLQKGQIRPGKTCAYTLFLGLFRNPAPLNASICPSLSSALATPAARTLQRRTRCLGSKSMGEFVFSHRHVCPSGAVADG